MKRIFVFKYFPIMVLLFLFTISFNSPFLFLDTALLVCFYYTFLGESVSTENFIEDIIRCPDILYQNNTLVIDPNNHEIWLNDVKLHGMEFKGFKIFPEYYNTTYLQVSNNEEYKIFTFPHCSIEEVGDMFEEIAKLVNMPYTIVGENDNILGEDDIKNRTILQLKGDETMYLRTIEDKTLVQVFPQNQGIVVQTQNYLRLSKQLLIFALTLLTSIFLIDAILYIFDRSFINLDYFYRDDFFRGFRVIIVELPMLGLLLLFLVSFYRNMTQYQFFEVDNETGIYCSGSSSPIHPDKQIGWRIIHHKYKTEILFDQYETYNNQNYLVNGIITIKHPDHLKKSHQIKELLKHMSVTT